MKFLLAVAALLVALQAHACPEFRVSFDKDTRAEAASGRLVVYLTKEGSRPWNREPADGPFFSDPQPMVGQWVRGVAPGDVVAVHTNTADAQFPTALHDLPHGTYKAQAVLDMHRDNSNWRREPGNLFSQAVEFELTKESPDPTIELKLDGVTPEFSVRPPPPPPIVSYVDIPSRILTAYWGRPMSIRAAIIFPRTAEENSRQFYPAVFEIPGFGGDHTRGASRRLQAAERAFRSNDNDPRTQAIRDIHNNAFWVVLDPEGPNGHHLFADSQNNGPYTTALATEFIPAIANAYPMVNHATARVLRGHSSGAWSSLWLALERPAIFGAAWASAPDPVDFTHFQLANIYTDNNMYEADGKDTPSYQRTDAEGNAKTLMTVREENRMEQVLGPDNTSAQQWDSWMAVFGPSNERGNPIALFDPGTGEINNETAERFRTFDITDRVRRDPARSIKIFDERIRLICGDADGFFLHHAVKSLDRELENQRQALSIERQGPGYIELVPGADHGSVLDSPRARAIPEEIAEHFRQAGYF